MLHGNVILMYSPGIMPLLNFVFVTGGTFNSEKRTLFVVVMAVVLVGVVEARFRQLHSQAVTLL